MMKKFIQGMVYALIFMVMPIHMSNTSEIMMTEEEKIALDNRIQEIIINNKIEREYELFYDNLNKSKSRCYVHDFFNKVIDEAIQSKSLPSVSIAQASLETGYGKYNKLKNNLFGIKGRGITTKTKEFYKGKFVTIRANFQYFPTVKDAFNKHYQILNRYGVRGYDYNFWIERIVACGYATDPNYDKKLNYIIDRFELHRLDNIQRYKQQISNIGEEKCNPLPIFTYKNV